MLIKGVIASQLYEYMKVENANESQNPDASMRRFCEKMEELIYRAIKNATITIPPATINVVAPPPTGVGTNPAPVVLPPNSIT